MIYNVQISEQAEADLRGIYEYIAFELLSPENAARQLDRPEKSIEKLNAMPRKFRAYNQEPWCSRGLRIMPVENYVIFYIPDDNSTTVTVIRVMYGGQDIAAKLQHYTHFEET